MVPGMVYCAATGPFWGIARLETLAEAGWEAMAGEWMNRILAKLLLVRAFTLIDSRAPVLCDFNHRKS